VSLIGQYGKTAWMEMTGRFDGSPAVVAGDYILRLLRVVLLLTLWRSLFAGKGQVNGMSLQAVLTYTLIAAVFQEQFDCRTKLQDTLWTGAITNRLLQPMGIFHQFTARTIGMWIPGLCLFSVPLLLLAPAIGVWPFPADVGTTLLFALSVVLAVLVGLALDFSFSALMLMAGQDMYSVNNIRNAVALFLSGALIPLALLPWGMGRVFEWFPFASMASTPLRIFTGTGSPAPLLLAQAGWCVALWPLALILWHAGRDRMVSHGG
jgi:ABC-2 type transport system permease protein